LYMSLKRDLDKITKEVINDRRNKGIKS